jgi:uncharacterized protein
MRAVSERGYARRSSSRGGGRVIVALLLMLVASLIIYKTGPALRAIHTARSRGVLNLRPYLASDGGSTAPLLIWTESLAYVRIIWPALAFGILIAAAAPLAVPPDWFARTFNGSKLRSTLSGAAIGVPLMLCSCCAAPVFEGMYGRTRRLDASLAMMLAAPALNPAALTLTFMLFPFAVAAARVALAAAALVGVTAIASLISVPTRQMAAQIPPRQCESLPNAYARSVLHVALRTVPFILVGIPAAILVFHRLGEMPSLDALNSFGTLIVFTVAVLLLPMPTLFEIPVAYSLLLIGVPLGLIVAVLFAGPAVNLPSLLIVGRTAGIKACLFLAVLVGGLAIATALMLPH